jgi:hypothetical protein
VLDRPAQLLKARADIDPRPARLMGAVMLGLGVLLPHLPGDPGVPCPLRTTTGVPCPLCGLTTSVKATLRGHVGAAAAANPFGLLAVVVAVILLLRPSLRRIQVRSVAIGVGIAVSWCWELHRFHLV